MKSANLGLLGFGLLGLGLQSGNGVASNIRSHPNIIFFLVDDMGWMDCTVNDSKYYETPNIERLAKRGILFSNDY
jgi:hypothetical protein